MAATRMTPIAKDALVFFVWMAALMVGVWVAVSYGVDFGPGGGIAPWAALLLLAVGGLGTALIAFWWYYVYPEERTPARGEFTLEQRHIRGGAGSFRTKPPGPGVRQEPEYRMTAEPGFVPRTRARWMGWFALMLVAVVISAVLVAYGRVDRADPMSWLLVAAGLVGAAVMLGALAVGEMGHEGPWSRRPPRA